MAKFSVGIEEDEGPSNRFPKRQRVERVLDIEGSDQEESESEEASEGAEESDREEELEESGAEQGAMSPQTARDGSISITLTDPEVLDCSICYDALSIPVFQFENGHIACSTCCIKMRNRCPSCSTTIGNRLHFGIVHRYSVTRFLYDRLVPITVGVSEKSLILREEVEGSLFILHNKVETLGNVVTLSRIGPSTERGFFYELIVKAQADVSTLKLKSFTKSSPKQVDSPQSLGFLLIPSQFCSASRQIKMNLRVWRSNRFSCSLRPGGA
ncbi:hypothetical protein GQ457_06G026750 [Hibiscus cannabinus]